MAVTVERARLIRAMLFLDLDGGHDLMLPCLYRHDVFVVLTAFLTIPDQHHGRAEIACVAHEATGIANGAACIRQHFEIVFRIHVCDGSQPCRSLLIAKDPDALADVVRARIDVWP